MKTDPEQPNKIVEVKYSDRTFFTLIIFAFCVFLGIVIYFRSSSDSELLQSQQDTITNLNQKTGEYVEMIDQLHQEKAFLGGQLIEQVNIFGQQCSEVVGLLEDHLLEQKKMISQFVLPRREVKE